MSETQAKPSQTNEPDRQKQVSSGRPPSQVLGARADQSQAIVCLLPGGASDFLKIILGTSGHLQRNNEQL